MARYAHSCFLAGELKTTRVNIIKRVHFCAICVPELNGIGSEV